MSLTMIERRRLIQEALQERRDRAARAFLRREQVACVENRRNASRGPRDAVDTIEALRTGKEPVDY